MRFSILAVLAAALLAAVAAHAGIDIAGDYLLPDDTYDHVAHGSRALVSLIALLCASGAGVLFVRALFDRVTSLPSRARLMRLGLRAAVRYSAVVAVLALACVPLMEMLDALRAGNVIDSLSDAFGGSLLLGGSVTLACALTICALVFGVVAWLCRYREDVARLVGALLERRDGAPVIAFASRICAGPIPRARELRAQRRGKRGPPLRACAIPVTH